MAPLQRAGKNDKQWFRYDPMKTSPDMKDRKFMKSEKTAESAK